MRPELDRNTKAPAANAARQQLPQPQPQQPLNQTAPPPANAAAADDKRVWWFPPLARAQWPTHCQFVFACLGFCVGLGNVWRFPYLCAKYGGGAFLIPYVLFLVVAGVPVFYLELSLGQFAGTSPAILFARLCPLFSGLAHTMVLVALNTAVYYNVVIAWALYYLFNCFAAQLPFKGCHHPWNTPRCFDAFKASECADMDKWYLMGACHNRLAVVQYIDGTGTAWNYTRTEAEQQLLSAIYVDGQCVFNSSDIKQLVRYRRHLATNGQPFDEYTMKLTSTEEFKDYSLGQVTDCTQRDNASGHCTQYEKRALDQLGWPQWNIVLCYLLAWLLVFSIVSRGIKFVGKILNVTVCIPYACLTVLVIMGCSLPGAWDGIAFYVTPNLSGLANGEAWRTAAGMVCFSLSTGYAGLSTLASYNRFDNNLLRDTVLITTIDSATSIFAGFAIFPIIGNVAATTGKPISSLVQEGPSLAFIAYPQALVNIRPPQLWSAAFFLLLVVLGLNTMSIYVETAISALGDLVPRLRRGRGRLAVAAGLCATLFLLGIPYTCQSGAFLLEFVDDTITGISVLLVVVLELGLVTCCYGVEPFVQDIEMMLGGRPGRRRRYHASTVYLSVCWAVLAPLALFVSPAAAAISSGAFVWGLSVTSWTEQSGLHSGHAPHAPKPVPVVWLWLAGLLLAALFLALPVVALYRLAEMWRRTGRIDWPALVSPTAEWQPNVASLPAADDGDDQNLMTLRDPMPMIKSLRPTDQYSYQGSSIENTIDTIQTHDNENEHMIQ